MVLGLQSGFSGKLPSPINHAMNIDCGALHLSKSFMWLIKKVVNLVWWEGSFLGSKSEEAP